MLLKYDFPAETLERTLPPHLPAYLDSLDNLFPDLDAIVLPSKDPFISEYVPLSNNLRYGITGFTGSVGDAIYFSRKFRAQLKDKTGHVLHPVMLFVDGRYHLQADQETQRGGTAGIVQVIKVEVEPQIESSMLKTLFEIEPLAGVAIRLGLDYERTSVASLERYLKEAQKNGSQVFHVRGDLLLEALKLKGWRVDRPIRSVSEAVSGRSIHRTLSQLAEDLQKTFGTSETIHVTAATDDAAFLLNARGYHLPQHSSVLAYTFFYKRELVVFLPSSSENCEMQLEASQWGDFVISVVRASEKELDLKLRAMIRDSKLEVIAFNGAAMNALLPSKLKKLFAAEHSSLRMASDYRWLLQARAKKTPQEMETIRKAFIKSSRAIAKTLRWGKTESQRRAVSEFDLAQYLYQTYADEGATALSFKTISGAGANSAIVHYNTPSRTVCFEKGMLALLDSGAYFEDGFCTDCTRGFFVGSEGGEIRPAAWQKEIYTATLKAAIQVFLNPVPATWSGRDVDAMIRGRVRDAGYDYLHGTGHGIGIHVHEEGIRLSTLSVYPQSPHACVSVEPGIYLKDLGGVRVENVALLHLEGEFYRYENVVFVGYDWDLIDLDRLTTDEKAYLKDYEAKCTELGTALTACPL